MERDTYRQALARMLKVDERSLMGTQAQGPVVRRKPRVDTGQTQRQKSDMSVVVVNPTMRIESYCLGVLFRKPELLFRLDRRLQEARLTALAKEDFEYTDHQLLFSVVRSAVEQDENDHHHYVMNHLPEAVDELSKELLSRTEKVDFRDDKLTDELLSRFIDLRRANAMTSINQLRFLQEEEQQVGGTNLKMYREQTLQLTKLVDSLDQAKRKLSSKRQA